MSAVEWDGPDEHGWTWAASPGGGVLIMRPEGGSWVPAWTTSDGFILWRGSPVRTRLAAQRAAERQAALSAQVT